MAENDALAAATTTAPTASKDTTPPLSRFFSDLKAVAVLFKANDSWQIMCTNQLTDGGEVFPYFPSPPSGSAGTDNSDITDKGNTLYVSQPFHPTVLFAPLDGSVGNSRATDQVYWNPETVAIPDGWGKAILVISLSTGIGGQPPLQASENNRQAHSFRVTVAGQITVEYLGAFGGATSSTVSNAEGPVSALGAPPAPVIGQKDSQQVLVQTSFVLVNALTQRSRNPITFSLALTPSFTFPVHSTNGQPIDTLAVGIQPQMTFGYSTPQTTQPPPTFVVSCNLILTRPPSITDDFFFNVPFAETSPPVIDDTTLDNLNAWFNALASVAPPSPDAWSDTMPPEVRDAVRLGFVTVHLKGFAQKVSTTKDTLTSSQQRCDAVRVALQGPQSATGSGTQGGLLGADQVKFDVIGLAEIVEAPATSRVEIRIKKDEAIAGVARMSAS